MTAVLEPNTLTTDDPVTTRTVGAYVTRRIGVAGSPSYILLGRVIGVDADRDTATVVGASDIIYDGDVPFRVFRDIPVDDLLLHFGGKGDSVSDRYKVGLPEIARAVAATPTTVSGEPDRTEVLNLQAQLQMARDELATARNERYQLQATYDQFRTTVRETAITYAERHDWCSVVDSALKEMGMEPRTREWSFTVEVTARQTVTITRSGVTEEDARETIGTSDVRDYVSSYNWEFDGDDWEVTDSEGIDD